MTVRNIKPEIGNSVGAPMKGQENQLAQPSVSQLLTQFQKPPQSFQSPAYPAAEHQNYQMSNTQATVNRFFEPPQNHNQVQHPNVNYIQAPFDGSLHQDHRNNFLARNPPSYGAPMPQRHLTPSNWNTSNHSTSNWYRDGNNVVGDYQTIPNGGAMNYNDNFSSAMRHNGIATFANMGIVPHNINTVDANLPDLNSEHIDVNFFDSSFSRLSFDEINENAPTR